VGGTENKVGPRERPAQAYMRRPGMRGGRDRAADSRNLGPGEGWELAGNGRMKLGVAGVAGPRGLGMFFPTRNCAIPFPNPYTRHNSNGVKLARSSAAFPILVHYFHLSSPPTLAPEASSIGTHPL
jgi:hypothetical protein